MKFKNAKTFTFDLKGSLVKRRLPFNVPKDIDNIERFPKLLKDVNFLEVDGHLR